MKKSDCQDCQHLNRAYMWCRRYFRRIEDPEKETCEDFLPLLWITQRRRLKRNEAT